MTDQHRITVRADEQPDGTWLVGLAPMSLYGDPQLTGASRLPDKASALAFRDALLQQIHQDVRDRLAPRQPPRALSPEIRQLGRVRRDAVVLPDEVAAKLDRMADDVLFRAQARDPEDVAHDGCALADEVHALLAARGAPGHG